MSSSERTFLQENGVLITNTRAILEGKTYAMSNVTSVDWVRIDPNQAPPAFLIIVSAVIAIAGVMTLVQEKHGGGPATFIGLVLGALGVFWLRLLKPDFAVRIGNSSGETDGLRSRDKEFIKRVANAMNKAIISRG